MMKKEILLDLGLNKNEAEVYLKLLELGPSTAVQVAQGSKLHRPNVYDALNKLVKKGLVAHFMREDVKYYEVVDPEQLMTLLKAKELELETLMPQLKVMQLTAKPPSSVAIFEGIAGARRMFMEIINNTKKEFYVLGVPRDLAKTMGEGWIKEWHNKRVKKKLRFHHIVNEDYYPHRIKLLRKMPYTTIKFLPKEYNAPNSIFVYDKGVIIMFINPMVSIRLLGEEVARSFRSYFKMLEKIAKEKAPQEK